MWLRLQQWAFLASFLIQTLLFFDLLPTEAPVGYVLLDLVLHLFVVGLMVMLLSAMRRHVIVVALYGLLSMVPIGNLVLMVMVSSQAMSLLKKAGVVVGLLGASEQDVAERIDRNVCRQCGYSLTGNTSGRCPECGTVVANRSPDASRLPPL